MGKLTFEADKIKNKAQSSIFLVLFTVILFFSPSFPLFGQNPHQQDPLTLKVAVIGPGNELYFWWGHIGIVIEDNTRGQVRFYDWGVFSFENENFFANFALGNLFFSCMVSWAESYYETYIRTNRDITLYTLDLPMEKKEAVLAFAENNVLPENRDYRYHHFRDNCATRVRDILDMALDGQFSDEFGEAPGRYTLRQHVRRHTWHNQFIDWLLNFLMGQGIDLPTTVWEEMFLPSEIGAKIKDFRYTDNEGRERALVSSVETIYRAKGRPEVLDVPLLQWPKELLFSLVVSGLLLLSYLLLGKLKNYRVPIGIINSFFGLFFGIAGSLLFFMTFISAHDYTYDNSNIFFVNPLFLALIPLGLIFAFSASDKKRFIAARVLKVFWICTLLGGFFTMVIKLFPMFYQQNQVTQALLLPITLTMIFIMSRLGRLKAG